MLLGEMLVERGLATVSEVATALERQRVSGGHLGARLIGMGVLTALDLYELLKVQKDARASLEFCEQMVARWETEFGTDHPTTSKMRCKLASALLANGRADEALAVSQTAYDCLRAMAGNTNPLTIEAAAVKNMAYSAAHGRAAAAVARLRARTQTSQIKMPEAAA